MAIIGGIPHFQTNPSHTRSILIKFSLIWLILIDLAWFLVDSGAFESAKENSPMPRDAQGSHLKERFCSATESQATQIPSECDTFSRRLPLVFPKMFRPQKLIRFLPPNLVHMYKLKRFLRSWIVATLTKGKVAFGKGNMVSVCLSIKSNLI